MSDTDDDGCARIDVDRRRPDILVVDNAFADADKARLTHLAETASFDEQRLGPQVMQHGRERAVIEAPEIAELLWSRIGASVGPIAEWFPDAPRTIDPSIDAWQAVGCNPRSRLYRYGRGGDFSPHYDEAWKPAPFTRSVLTVLVYLPAGGCEGGETVVDTGQLALSSAAAL